MALRSNLAGAAAVTGKPAFIYGLTDPLSGLVRYVGQTQQSLEERLHNHIAEAMPKRYPFSGNHAKRNWLQSLLYLDLLPGIELLETVDSRHADMAEAQVIAEHLDAGHDLLNLTLTPDGWCRGGDACPTRGHAVAATVSHDTYIAARMAAARWGISLSDYIAHAVETALEKETCTQPRGNP